MPPKILVPAEGPRRAKVMLIGEAPGGTEVELGRPFVGRSGRFLNKTLAEVGIDRKRCYVTNVVKFRPTRIVDGKVKDRCPTDKEIGPYTPLLRSEIRDVNPKIAILLGHVAIRAVLDVDQRLADIHGKTVRRYDNRFALHESGYTSTIFIPTYHPGVAMRNRALRRAFADDMKIAARIMRNAEPKLVNLQPRKADWHLHTIFSDGHSNPADVVERSKHEGLKEIAICDHDNTSGVGEAAQAGKRLGVRVLPGIELTVNDIVNGKRSVVHILGIGIDTKNPQLRKACGQMAGNRHKYVHVCVAKFRKAGFRLDPGDVYMRATGVPGLPHVKAAVLEKPDNARKLAEKYGKDFKDGAMKPIEGVILRGLSIRRAISVIHEAGGTAVLAHPGFNGLGNIAKVPDAKIRQYARLGLDGIELSKRYQNAKENGHYAKLASSLRLIAALGSDSHK